MRLRPLKTGLKVADGAFLGQAGLGGHCFEAMALAGVLALAGALGGLAVAVALALMHIVACLLYTSRCV